MEDFLQIAAILHFYYGTAISNNAIPHIRRRSMVMTRVVSPIYLLLHIAADQEIQQVFGGPQKK